MKKMKKYPILIVDDEPTGGQDSVTYIKITTCGTCPPINTQSGWAQG